MNYLLSRKIALPTIEFLQIGWQPKVKFNEYSERILFPVRDMAGRVVTFQGRALFDWEKAKRPKYWHKKFLEGYGENFVKNRHLHGFYENAREAVRQGVFYLVEGQFDVAALHACGLPAASAMGSAFSEMQMLMLAQTVGHLVHWKDPDSAGDKSNAKIITLAKRWGVSLDTVVSDMDASQYFQINGAKKTREYVEKFRSR